MDNSLLVLKLVLDELNVPSDIGSIGERKRIQKTVYLAQLTGIDLGYRYGWYLKGPYSTELTKDYYSLAEAVALGDRDWEGKHLRASVRNRLAVIRPLLDVPRDVQLSQEDWLELIASLHYQRKIRGRPDDEAIGLLKNEKPALWPFVEDAQRALAAAKLLPPNA